LTFIKECGIMVEPQEGMGLDEFMRVAGFVEKQGFGYFFRSDHLFPTTRRKGLESPECWVTLGALAVATKTLKFGPMVSPIGFRNPALLARMACTVNSLSSGRLQLGVGAGWYEDEYLAHGFSFPPVKTRIEEFHEALEIIRPLTQTGRVDFEGKYFSAHLEDLPKHEQRMHMIIGGKGRSVVSQTAKYADEWNFFGSPPEGFEEMKEGLRASKRKIKISQMASFMIADNARSLEARIRSEMRRQGVRKDATVYSRELSKSGWLIAQTRDFAEKVNELREKGVDRFYYQVWQVEAWLRASRFMIPRRRRGVCQNSSARVRRRYSLFFLEPSPGRARRKCVLSGTCSPTSKR
jgi:alkanesulfonate monooxygenase SsuD/methylene tetrahydromethanopterin reductase-like flavin-dependent oxidoreductase (luciferase family)